MSWGRRVWPAALFLAVVIVVQVAYGWRALADDWPRLVHEWIGTKLDQGR